MSERKRKRVNLIYYLRAFDTSSGELLGYVVDVTPEGMMLRSTVESAPGRVLSLNMDLPYGTESQESESQETERLAFDAEVKWCSGPDERGFFQTGLQIDRSSHAARETVRDLIDRFHRLPVPDPELEESDPFLQNEDPDILE